MHEQLQAAKTVRLIENARQTDIASINGNVRLRLATEIETVALANPKVGDRLERDGLRLDFSLFVPSLQNLDGSLSAAQIRLDALTLTDGTVQRPTANASSWASMVSLKHFGDDPYRGDASIEGSGDPACIYAAHVLGADGKEMQIGDAKIEVRPGVWVAKLSTNGTPNAIELVACKDVEQVEFPFGVAVAGR